MVSNGIVLKGCKSFSIKVISYDGVIDPDYIEVII